MNTYRTDKDLPKDFLVFQEAGFSDPDDPNRPNRLCVCFSDVHFTDGTVGNQSAETVVWENVFGRIKELCRQHDIRELHLLLAGDVVDMIRTAQWAKTGVYPWERDKPQFRENLQVIIQGIIENHSKPGTQSGFSAWLKRLLGSDHSETVTKPGFFYWLNRLSSDLSNVRIQKLVLLGNHDKEMLADNATLKKFYEECLGQPLPALSVNYKQWIGQMYFSNPDHYLNGHPDAAPWLPFYWGDRGFRLFITHGQWRDEDNCRAVKANSGLPGWKVSDGWDLAAWRKLCYSPFTEPCFGDTVAAGLLAGFIFRTKEQLQGLIKDEPRLHDEITRLLRILDELDLYRPTYLAVGRMIEETWRLREKGGDLIQVNEIIEKQLSSSMYQWLSWDFTRQSARPLFKAAILCTKILLSVMKFFSTRLELRAIYWMMRAMSKLKTGLMSFSDAPSYQEILSFPAFLPEYRNYGFRIHSEGHTHISLQEELYFPEPVHSRSHKSYTYINLGAWRDQIVTARKGKYRRRGIGRALCILDLVPDAKSGADGKDRERRFNYWIEDITSWGDNLDRL